MPIIRVQPNKPSGFTLIELLIVLLLMGLVLGGVLQSVSSKNDNGRYWLGYLGDNIYHMMMMAGTRPSEVGFFIDDGDYAWKSLQVADEGSEDPQWVSLVSAMQMKQLPANFTIDISVATGNQRAVDLARVSSLDTPVFVVKRDGELLPPVTITLTDSNTQARWSLALDGFHAPEWVGSAHD